MMLRHVLNGLLKRRATFFKMLHVDVYNLQAHDTQQVDLARMLIDQQCCVNVAKREQHLRCCTKNLTVFKFDPTLSNMLQHIATGWPNIWNMLCPTLR